MLVSEVKNLPAISHGWLLLNSVIKLFVRIYNQTGLALFYTLMLIGQHEKVQERLHREIDHWYDSRSSSCISSDGTSNESGDSVEGDLISSKSYLDAVIRESLRLFPPVPRIARTVSQEVRIRGSVSSCEYVIPEGTTVTIDVFQIQRDPSAFPNPDSFDPERHLSSTPGIHPSKALMPFSLGPRSCIGSKFALMELKIFLIKVLRKFRIECETAAHELDLAVEIVLKPAKAGVEIRFIERSEAGTRESERRQGAEGSA